jgi:nicotinate-nucleotide--dimethylbenzimidazole phosphoribosyltransferase
MSARPFDDILALLTDLPGPDTDAQATARAAVGSNLGRLADIAGWAAAWSGRPVPQVNRPILALYAGSHASVAVHGGAERERLELVAAGGADVSRLAAGQGAGLEAFDLAVDRPVPNIEEAPAMGERECAATIAFGMEVMAKQPDLLIIGSIGAGAALSGAALAVALNRADPDQSDPRAARAATRVRGEDSPLELLRQLGGRETAAALGAIVAARVQRTPVLLDGPAALSAAAVLDALVPGSVSHCRAADADAFGLSTCLDAPALMEVRIGYGEGSGGILALGLVRAACSLAAPQ